ncbi:hypothetical protein HA402_005770 [Bradysia odoriphaga]|nr:hypothetical protein HA402_005770 [Bradysia odoriphaga]
MKVEIICVIFCAIALNFSFDVVNSARSPHPPTFANSSSGFDFVNFEKLLYLQYYRLEENITEHSWQTCNRTYSVPGREGFDMFENVQTTEMLKYVNRTHKCLVDCTMREMGVVTDDGLNVAEYMLQIKILRLNYTLFDRNEKSTETRQIISDVINNQTIRFLAHDSCWRLANQTVPHTDSNVCYELIKSYEKAANKCKDVEDSNGDSCETSFMILRCMNEDHRRRLFNSPFYPIPFTKSSALATLREAFNGSH